MGKSAESAGRHYGLYSGTRLKHMQEAVLGRNGIAVARRHELGAKMLTEFWRVEVFQSRCYYTLLSDD